MLFDKGNYTVEVFNSSPNKSNVRVIPLQLLASGRPLSTHLAGHLAVLTQSEKSFFWPFFQK